MARVNAPIKHSTYRHNSFYKHKDYTVPFMGQWASAETVHTGLGSLQLMKEVIKLRKRQLHVNVFCGVALSYHQLQLQIYVAHFVNFTGADCHCNNKKNAWLDLFRSEYKKSYKQNRDQVRTKTTVWYRRDPRQKFKSGFKPKSKLMQGTAHKIKKDKTSSNPRNKMKQVKISFNLRLRP